MSYRIYKDFNKMSNDSKCIFFDFIFTKKYTPALFCFDHFFSPLLKKVSRLFWRRWPRTLLARKFKSNQTFGAFGRRTPSYPNPAIIKPLLNTKYRFRLWSIVNRIKCHIRRKSQDGILSTTTTHSKLKIEKNGHNMLWKSQLIHIFP